MEPRKPPQSPSPSSSTPGRAYSSSVKTARSPAVVAPVRPVPPGGSSGGGVVLPKITPPSNPASSTISPGGSAKRMGWTTPRNPADPVPASSRPSANPSSPPSRPAAPLSGEAVSSSSSNGNIGYWDNGAPTVGNDSVDDTEDDEAVQLSYMDQMYSKIQMLNAELDREREQSRAKATDVEYQVGLRERATLEASQRYGTLNEEESENFGVVGAKAPLTSSWETNASTVNQKFRPHQPRSTSPPQPAAVLGKDQLELCAALGKNAELRIRSREIERQADQTSSVLEQTQRQMKMAERRIANREEKLRALLKEKLHWQNEIKDLREQVVEEKMRQVDLMRRLETMKRETSAQLGAMAQTARDFEEDNQSLRAYLAETKGQLAAQTKRLEDVVKLAKEEKEKLTECIVDARGKFREWKESESVSLRAQKDQALNHLKAEYELKIARHQEEKQKLRDKVKDLEVSVRLMQKDRTLSPLELSLRKATIMGSKDNAGTTEAELIEANVRIKELEALLEHSQEFQKRQESIIKVSEATISRLIQEREVAALDVLANQRLPGSHTWSESPVSFEISSLSPLAMSTVPASSPPSMALSPRQLAASVRPQHKLPNVGPANESATLSRIDPSPPPRQRVDHPARPSAPPPRSVNVMSPARKPPNGRFPSEGSEYKLGDSEDVHQHDSTPTPTQREKELIRQIEEMQAALDREQAAQSDKALAAQQAESPTVIPDECSSIDSRLEQTESVKASEVKLAESHSSRMLPACEKESAHPTDQVFEDERHNSSEPNAASVFEYVNPGHIDANPDEIVDEIDKREGVAPSFETSHTDAVQDDSQEDFLQLDASSLDTEANDADRSVPNHDRNSAGETEQNPDPPTESNEQDAADSQVSSLNHLGDDSESLLAVTSLRNVAGNEDNHSIDVDVEAATADTCSTSRPQRSGTIQQHLDAEPTMDEVNVGRSPREEDATTSGNLLHPEGVCSVRKIAECVVTEAEQTALSTLSRTCVSSVNGETCVRQPEEESVCLATAQTIDTVDREILLTDQTKPICTVEAGQRSNTVAPLVIIEAEICPPSEQVQADEDEDSKPRTAVDVDNESSSCSSPMTDIGVHEGRCDECLSNGTHARALESDSTDPRSEESNEHTLQATTVNVLAEGGIDQCNAAEVVGVKEETTPTAAGPGDILMRLVRVKATSVVVATAARAVGIVAVAAMLQARESHSPRSADPAPEDLVVPRNGEGDAEGLDEIASDVKSSILVGSASSPPAIAADEIVLKRDENDDGDAMASGSSENHFHGPSSVSRHSVEPASAQPSSNRADERQSEPGEATSEHGRGGVLEDDLEVAASSERDELPAFSLTSIDQNATIKESIRTAATTFFQHIQDQVTLHLHATRSAKYLSDPDTSTNIDAVRSIATQQITTILSDCVAELVIKHNSATTSRETATVDAIPDGVVSSVEEASLESAAPTEAEPVVVSEAAVVEGDAALSSSEAVVVDAIPDGVVSSVEEASSESAAPTEVEPVSGKVAQVAVSVGLANSSASGRLIESDVDTRSLRLSDNADPPIVSMPVKSKTESWNDLVGGNPFFESPRLSPERSSVPVVKSPVMAFPDPSRYASAIVREMIRDPTLLAYDVKHEQAQPFALMDERILMIDQHARHMQHDENDKARVSVVDDMRSSRHTAAIEGVLVTKRKKMDDETRRKSIALRIIPAFNYEPVLIKFQWSDFVVATPIRLMSSGSQLNVLHSLGAGSTMNIGGATNIERIEEAPKKAQLVPSLVQKMRLIVKKGVKLPCGTYAIMSVFIRPLEDGNENLRIQIYDSERVEEFQYDFHEDHLRDYVEQWTGSADEARAFFERLVFRSEQGSIIIKMPDKLRVSAPASPEPSTDEDESEPRVYTPTPMSQLLTNLATTQPLELPPEPQYRLSPNAPTSPQRLMPPLAHQFSAPNRLELRAFIQPIEEDNESMASSVLKR